MITNSLVVTGELLGTVALMHTDITAAFLLLLAASICIVAAIVGIIYGITWLESRYKDRKNK